MTIKLGETIKVREFTTGETVTEDDGSKSFVLRPGYESFSNMDNPVGEFYAEISIELGLEGDKLCGLIRNTETGEVYGLFETEGHGNSITEDATVTRIL